MLTTARRVLPVTIILTLLAFNVIPLALVVLILPLVHVVLTNSSIWKLTHPFVLLAMLPVVDLAQLLIHVHVLGVRCT